MITLGRTIPTPLRQGLLPLSALVACSLASTVAVYILLLEPVQVRVRVAETAYQAGKQTAARLERERQVQIRAQVAERRLTEMWRALPTKDEFSALAMTITELGRAEHMVIPGMSYTLDDKKKQAGLPVNATLTFSATGDYHAFARFIYRLEHAEQYLVIESLDVARAPASETLSADRVVFHVKVRTFLRPTAHQAVTS